MGARRRFGRPRAIVLVACIPILLSTPVGAAEKELPASPKKKAFHGLARLGAKVRSELGIWEATLLTRNEKGKTVKEKRVLEVPAELPVLFDGKVSLEDLAAGDVAFILGREVERDVQSKVSKGGESRGGTDRQIQNARAILSGRDVEVDEAHREGRDKTTRWHKTEVKMSGAGLWVKYEEHEYRVTLERTAPILKRARGERDLLKTGATVLVRAEEEESGEGGKKRPLPPGPGGKGKAAGESRLTCKLLVVIDPRLAGVYEAVLP